MILRGGVFGKHRIARHLWRMCFALFVAAASVFLGQPQVFPALMREGQVLFVPVVLVVAVLFYWLIRVLFTNWYKQA